MKNNVYHFKPQFYCINVGFNWSKLYRYVFFRDVMDWKIEFNLSLVGVEV